MKKLTDSEQLKFNFGFPVEAERDPATVIQEWSRNYESSGLTLDLIKRRLLPLNEFVLSGRSVDRLYISSSDDLESLTRIDTHGKTVLTVAGSGDFPLIFSQGGAKEVVVTDISWLALLWSELKIASLLSTPRTCYRELFSIPGPAILRGKKQIPLINSIYRQVNLGQIISPQARFTFDQFSDSSGQECVVLNQDENGDNITEPIYIRSNSRTPQITHSKDSFEKMVMAARRTAWSPYLLDINKSDFSHIKEHRPDIAYISNVGYDPHSTFIHAISLLKIGVKLVFFSARFDDIGYESLYTFSNTPFASDGVFEAHVLSRDPKPLCGVTLVAGRKRDLDLYPHDAHS